MASEPHISRQGLLLLTALLENPLHGLCGSELMKATGLPSGTAYPILLRFEQYGLLKSAWETEEPTKLGRPRRRLYWLTRSGGQAARAALDQFVALTPALGLAR